MTAGQRTWARGVMLAAAILPILVAIARALARDWFPIGDNALLYIRVVDVATAHHPLLGSWTSASLSVGEHMNNPGPIYQDLLAPFAKLLAPGPGAAVGVGTLNILTVVGISVSARRIGGWMVEQWALLATVALVWTMGSELLIDIWQAHALMLPFMLFLVLVVGLADGQTWTIGWSLAVASVLVQTHISYAYVLAFLWPAAAISYARVRRSRPHLSLRDALRTRRVLVLTLGLLLIWSQSLIEQFFGPGKGNLSRLAGHAGGGDLQVGMRQALGISARVYALPPWWLRSGFSSSVPSTPLTGTPDHPLLEVAHLPNALVALLALAALLAVLAIGVRRHRSSDHHVLGNASLIAVVGVVGSVLAVANLTVGPVGLAAHHVRLLWPLAVFVHATAFAVIVAALPATARPRLEFAMPVVAVLVSLASLQFHEHPQGPLAFSSTMTAMRRIFPQLDQLAALDPVLYDVRGVRPFEPFSSTMMMELQRRGIEFRVDDDILVRQLGESRRADGSEQARVFQLQGAPAVLYDGAACRIGIASELPPDDEATALQDAEHLVQQLNDGSIRIDEQAIDGTNDVATSLLHAAVGGDRDAARTLVYEGYLSGWSRNGQASSDTPIDDAISLVDRYMNSVFALFSDQSQPCAEG